MYKTSTHFIKGQIPEASVADLLELYRQELEEQSVSNIQIDGNCIKFSNETFKFVPNRYANKFSGFASGQINIEDNGTEYIVTFEADNSRTFSVAGIIAGAITLISLVRSNFDLSSLVTGLVVFGLLSVIGYGISAASFPVYFTGVRNKIERRIQSLQRQI